MHQCQDTNEASLSFCGDPAEECRRWPEPEMKITNCFSAGDGPFVWGGSETRRPCRPPILGGGPMPPPGMGPGPVLPCPNPCCRLPGLQLQLTAGTSLANQAPVLFDTVVNCKSGSLCYTPGSGKIIVTQPGNYLILWSVQLRQSTAGKVIFALNRDGDPVASAEAWLERGPISSTALLTVNCAPASIALVNRSGAAVLYDTALGIRANLVILQVL